MLPIIAFTTCERYDLAKFKTKLKKENIKIKDYKDFILFETDNKVVLLFVYGAGVIFGEENLDFLNKIKDIEIKPYKPFYEKYFYKKCKEFSILKDNFCFHLDNEELKIAVGYALSQSIKLNYFEEEIYNEIEKTSFIPVEIAKYGYTKLNSKQLSKLRGEVFMSKSLLNLQYEFLDEPEYFWDYPDYLKFYNTTKNYLDIPNRIEVLNKKMDVLEELFDMLSDELKHKHEAFLEWVIIILIIIEIFISIFHEVLKLF